MEEKGRYVNNGYYGYDICRQCKGKKCCAHFGCMYSPHDFIVLKDEKYTHEQRLLILVELLKQGKISIDMCWGKDRYWGPLNPISRKPDIDKMANGDGFLYLRARNKNQPVIDLQQFLNEGNDYPCINWDPEKGCCLSEEERPFIGRMLMPVMEKSTDGNISFKCKLHGEVETVELWGKYQLLMYDLYLKIRDLDIR